MAWVESVSPSFRARHDSNHADDADRVLHSLERTREYLAQYFPRTIAGISVVFHPGLASLAIARPLMPVAWIATAPAARRYVAGWSGPHELHVLLPDALEARASSVPGSREMLARAIPALYAREVIVENNADLPKRLSPRRLGTELRWAWLFEGAARWFGGQTAHARPAIARRLREGRRPAFPPSVRDAPLLGGTVIDLLVHQGGETAAAHLARRLHPHGPRGALREAFRGRATQDVEQAWRAHLARMASGA
ncbi:MAG: hypothetical protein JO262_10850 [Solirubrobacterales bacterium]|nr:hypothetical protein [Solirubrobacterales bacterium]MBV9942616.1 hypothetical protein [Solirubrobacterales bacterium]